MEINIKVGDLITAYHAGIHRVIEIERRFHESTSTIPSDEPDTKIGDEYSPIIKYELVLRENGEIPKVTKINSCDYYYCKPAYKFIVAKNEENNLLNKIFKLLQDGKTTSKND